MFDHKQTLGHLTAQLARIAAGRLRDALAPLGLLPAQFTALAEIAMAEGMTQKQLVERLDLEQPGVARTLAGLERLGWIERHALAGRSHGLWLTERAREVLPAALAAAETVDSRLTASLTTTECAQLLDQLLQLVEEQPRG
ncbi:MAG TPA: MarR family transcriptional regulator [Devosiaceae bacterium]|jgi:DNA-binding MarR family transcriptional regulator|nr:MarR family transcriptional regulator [Devosiaceae bacterium]